MRQFATTFEVGSFANLSAKLGKTTYAESRTILSTTNLTAWRARKLRAMISIFSCADTNVGRGRRGLVPTMLCDDLLLEAQEPNTK
ncbi:hypothetical protein UNPF46_17370 [Bradyrhizobium sp. UNPF46]|nr:hypothetical protein UNPF46_17370 [Bradyrhizobium sp. UNPF46]